MSKPKEIVCAMLEPLLGLRRSDLSVRTAHVRRKDALPVLNALPLAAGSLWEPKTSGKAPR